MKTNMKSSIQGLDVTEHDLSKKRSTLRNRKNPAAGPLLDSAAEACEQSHETRFEGDFDEYPAWCRLRKLWPLRTAMILVSDALPDLSADNGWTTKPRDCPLRGGKS